MKIISIILELALENYLTSFNLCDDIEIKKI